jgi:hypothetical protein
MADVGEALYRTPTRVVTSSTGWFTLITVDSTDVQGFSDNYTLGFEVWCATWSSTSGSAYSGFMRVTGVVKKRSGTLYILEPGAPSPAEGADGADLIDLQLVISGTDILVQISIGDLNTMYHMAWAKVRIFSMDDEF